MRKLHDDISGTTNFDWTNAKRTSSSAGLAMDGYRSDSCDCQCASRGMVIATEQQSLASKSARARNYMEERVDLREGA
jgi:hypothetical protein